MLDVEIGVEIPVRLGLEGTATSTMILTAATMVITVDIIMTRWPGRSWETPKRWSGKPRTVLSSSRQTSAPRAAVICSMSRLSAVRAGAASAGAVRLVSLAPAPSPSPIYDHVYWCYYFSCREDDERVIWVELASGSYCRTTGSDGNGAPRRWTHACDIDIDDGLGVCTERHRRSGGQVGGGRGDETDGGETTDDELPFVRLPGIEAMGVGMRFMLPRTARPMLSVNPDVTMSPSTSNGTNRREFVGETRRPAEIV